MSTPAQRMVAEQLRPHGVTDGRVLEAMAGCPAGGPYDVSLVGAAARGAPPALLDQVAGGGRMVTPVATPADEPQDLRLYVRDGGDVLSRSLFPVLFVPLRTG